MNNTDQFLKAINILEKEFPHFKAPIVELEKATPKEPFFILITTLLSLRSRDEMTVLVIRDLYKQIKSPQDILAIPLEKLEKIIYKIGFYRQKAATLKSVCDVLLTQYQGKVPETLEELVSIKGIGRKTANIVLSLAYGVPTIAVDVHVHRISNRLGFLSTKTPYETEMALTKKVPTTYWNKVNRLLVGLGQTFCTPLSPHCSRCPINEYCEQVDVIKSR
jgi:endonuclease-3